MVYFSITMVVCGGRLCRRLVFYHAFALGWFSGGTGWDVHVSCTCTHGRCYANAGVGVGWGGMLATTNMKKKANLNKVAFPFRKQSFFPGSMCEISSGLGECFC